MTNRLLNLVSCLSLLFALAFGIIIFYWVVYPYKPMVFKAKVFPISNKIVKIGMTLSYVSDYCKNIDLPAMVTREFRNELIFVTPSTITNRPTGCHKILIGVLIPPELPAGKYIMAQTYTYQVNPIRTITVRENTEEFEVIK